MKIIVIGYLLVNDLGDLDLKKNCNYLLFLLDMIFYNFFVEKKNIMLYNM